VYEHVSFPTARSTDLRPLECVRVCMLHIYIYIQIYTYTHNSSVRAHKLFHSATYRFQAPRMCIRVTCICIYAYILVLTFPRYEHVGFFIARSTDLKNTGCVCVLHACYMHVTCMYVYIHITILTFPWYERVSFSIARSTDLRPPECACVCSADGDPLCVVLSPGCSGVAGRCANSPRANVPSCVYKYMCMHTYITCKCIL